MRRLAFAATAAALSVLLASCSSSSHSSTTTTQPATSPSSSATSDAATTSAASTSGAGITISGFAFSGTMTVKAGQKVTVTNNDSVAHTLTDKATHLFDTGNLAGGGGTGTFTAPTKPGSYPFGCTYHSNMHGTLTVTS
ncbi:MAG: cupredoxin domain-containing protein [Actinomycetota bacterium]|nr:cupredoxin domain-containing protein [Actinomycetota bacterium]